MVTTHESRLKVIFRLDELCHRSRVAFIGLARSIRHSTNDKHRLGLLNATYAFYELFYRPNGPRVRGPIWVYARRAIGQY
jgi:hypothetical protein